MNGSIESIRHKMEQIHECRTAIHSLRTAQADFDGCLGGLERKKKDLAEYANIKRTDIFEGEMAEFCKESIDNTLTAIGDILSCGRGLSEEVDNQIQILREKIRELEHEIINLED